MSGEFYYTTPKGELVRSDKLDIVALPPMPDIETLNTNGYGLGEPCPRVPVVGEDLWISPSCPTVVVGHGPCDHPSASMYHGLRWIIKRLVTPQERPKPEAEAVALAKWFHDTYERLAPQYQYETRPETREFKVDSSNGRLMIATCQEMINRSRSVEAE